MNLEMLLARAEEIDKAIINVSNQLNALHGHKAETDHWLKQMKALVVSEPQVESQVEPVVE